MACLASASRRLSTAFVEEVRSGGGTALAIDCGSIEPIERGLLTELGRMLGCAAQTDAVAAALAESGSPVLLALDGYEAFRLLDGWLRQGFLPSMPDRVLVLLASYLPPSAGWAEAPAWQGLFRTITLGPLSDEAAAEMLSRLDVPAPDRAEIARFAAGHPLALMLASRAAREPFTERAAIGRPVEAAVPMLARRYLASIEDVITRRVLRTTSIARRISRGLLRALAPDYDPDALYMALAELPFVAAVRDGLAVHEAVRNALAAELLVFDPDLHRQARRLAWRHVSHEARIAPAAELWRCTADLIYLIRNPVVRDAFFPPETAGLAVERARLDDFDAIRAITAEHDGHTGACCIERWWRAAPERSSSCALPGSRWPGSTACWTRPPRGGPRAPLQRILLWHGLPNIFGNSLCTVNRPRSCCVVGWPATRASYRQPCRPRAGWTSSAIIWSGGRSCDASISR